jgi:hypothetical protein
MSFAESLRIFSANIVQNIAVDNDIVFTDLINKTPYAVNPYTVVTDEEWNTYMTNNGIDINDRFFAKPNIYINKYLSSPDNSVGGSNILEFKTRYLNAPNNNIVFSINNKGHISIGANYNSNIPLKINITPENSNIIQYTNITDINKNYCINYNGFINIINNEGGGLEFIGGAERLDNILFRYETSDILPEDFIGDLIDNQYDDSQIEGLIKVIEETLNKPALNTIKRKRLNNNTFRSRIRMNTPSLVSVYAGGRKIKSRTRKNKSKK